MRCFLCDSVAAPDGVYASLPDEAFPLPVVCTAHLEELRICTARDARLLDVMIAPVFRSVPANA